MSKHNQSNRIPIIHQRLKPKVLAFAIASSLFGVMPIFMPNQIHAAEQVSQQHYSIAAGKLSDVLAEFAATAGVPLSFDPNLLNGLNSEGLQGQYSIEDGFDSLLKGSGYELTDTGNQNYSLRRSTVSAEDSVKLPTVKVSAVLYGSKETNTLGNSAASVGVIDAEAIENGQIRNFRDGFRQLANVMDGDWNDAGFVIRGLSSEGLVPGGAPVGSLYIDGVLQTLNGTRRGARGLWDVEQMEVYRGPQSTFSGRAAMAGAIYIKTRDPVFERETALSTTVGSDDLINTAFMFNTPVNDQIAMRVAGEYQRSKNNLNYPDYESFDRLDDMETDLYYNMRGKVLLTPDVMPDTSALLSYSFAHDAPVIRDIGGPDGLRADRGDFNTPTFTEVRLTRVKNAGLEITHDIDEALRFTSLTTAHHSLTKRPSVNAGTDGEINVVRGDQKDLLVTQELRLNYQQDRSTWVAGLYASHQNYDTTFDRTLFDFRNDQQFLERETNNMALFGEYTYEFIPTYKFTVGGRADYTRIKSDHENYRSQPLNTAPFVVSAYDTSVSEFNFVPKVGLSKAFGDNHLTGITYTEGFRTGGYGYNTSTAEVYEYDPEKAKNYEVFYKGQFLNQRLQLNANLFLTKYEDQQVEMRVDPSDPFYREIVNAASSKTWGIEIEPTFQVTRQFSTFASLGYLNTKFEDFNEANYGDLSGEEFPEAPEWTFSLGGHYQFDNGFYIGGDAKYTSDYMARLGTPPQDELDSRTIVNLQTGYRSEKWEVNAFVENVFDKRYYTYFDFDSAAEIEYATLGSERLVGVNVKVNF